MKITAIRAYQVDLPLKEGRYSWSNGNFVEVFDSTVVEVDTDAGITGWGRVLPAGLGLFAGLCPGGPLRAGRDRPQGDRPRSARPWDLSTAIWTPSCAVIRM